MSDFLDRMACGSLVRATTARGRAGESVLRTRASDMPVPPRLNLEATGFDVIAEIKRRSPSRGTPFGDSSSVAARARDYADAGAAAISVLTEPESFGGSLDDLRAASEAVAVPVMRKDFLVDPYQVFEARVAGAGGILLILRILDDTRLGEMLEAAREAGLFILLEAFDESDLLRAESFVDAACPEAQPLLVGLNCRDLRTLDVMPERFGELRPSMPSDVPTVAESGIDGPASAGSIVSLGYRMALVGTALMRATDPRACLRELLAAGRRSEEGTCACG